MRIPQIAKFINLKLHTYQIAWCYALLCPRMWLSYVQLSMLHVCPAFQSVSSPPASKTSVQIQRGFCSSNIYLIQRWLENGRTVLLKILIRQREAIKRFLAAEEVKVHAVMKWANGRLRLRQPTQRTDEQIICLWNYEEKKWRCAACCHISDCKSHLWSPHMAHAQQRLKGCYTFAYVYREKNSVQ